VAGEGIPPGSRPKAPAKPCCPGREAAATAKDENMDQAIGRAARLLGQARRVIALTGAGMSVASGIPDFRSPGGLWERHDPMSVATDEALRRSPRRVWEFLLDTLAMMDAARPNPGHVALARLEQAGRLAAVITQNIDGLHQAAGSRHVIEYHGGLGRFYCMGCGRDHDPDMARRLGPGDIPWRCRECGGVVRPDIVFFGEAIPLDALTKSGQLALAADCILVAGTSGEVAPANRLPWEVKAGGGVVVEINLTESTLSDLADARIVAPVEEALPLLADLVLSQPVTISTGEKEWTR
jgi:NAD-dependent deacetylase